MDTSLMGRSHLFILDYVRILWRCGIRPPSTHVWQANIFTPGIVILGQRLHSFLVCHEPLILQDKTPPRGGDGTRPPVIAARAQRNLTGTFIDQARPLRATPPSPQKLDTTTEPMGNVSQMLSSQTDHGDH